MWVQFMNATASSLTPAQSFIHGAHLVFLDALGCGSAMSAATNGKQVKKAACQHVRAVLEKHSVGSDENVESLGEFSYQGDLCGIPPFMISIGSPDSLIQPLFGPTEVWSVL